MPKGFASNSRINIVALVVVASFGLVVWKLTMLHHFDRYRYIQVAAESRKMIVTKDARRGDILDCRGDILATSYTLITIAADPEAPAVEKDREKWPELARLLNVPLENIQEAFAPKTFADGRSIRWVPIRKDVTESTYEEIKKLKMKSITADRSYIRTYPHKQLAAHIIGFINKESVPGGGVEAYLDFYLRSHKGWRESEKDGRRHERLEFRSREVSASAGYTVQLSIDSVIQHIVEREIEHIVGTLNPDKVSIIVSDPHSGFILAMGNYPTFDLNQFNKAPLEVQKNIAITDLIEPGSTFKIVAAAAALNEKAVTPSTQFDCSKTSIEYRGRTRRFMQDDHPVNHPLSVTEIIAKSSNIGTPQLAMAIGDEKFYEYIRAFGFSERSGFPFGGEIPGLLQAPSKWTVPDITRIPAGYSVAVTPLQIHYAMSVIANQGMLMQPQIIRQIRDADSNVVFDYKAVLRKTPISPETADVMAKMLSKVVIEGTGKNAAIPGYEVAGKTGTAQKIIDGRYSKKDHVGSFVGFFPASRPRVVISVIVDGGKPGNGRLGYGSTVAAPSFKRIGEQLVHYLNIEPVNPREIDPRGTPLRVLASTGGHE